jgi:hypothetical protein
MPKGSGSRQCGEKKTAHVGKVRVSKRQSHSIAVAVGLAPGWSAVRNLAGNGKRYLFLRHITK